MRTVVVLVILSSLVASAGAQDQAPTQSSPIPQGQATGPRDSAKPKESGTARISGRVVSGDTGAPLRRANVMLSGEAVKEGRSTSTDENGRYEFRDLPGGRYTLGANKAGYGWISYGQTRPFQPGRPLVLADGQALPRIDIALPRGGVIAGRVTDEFGEPVAGVSVQAMRYSYANGKKQLSPVGFASTDDRGLYRLFGLAASEYYVSAQLRDGFHMGTSDSRAGFSPTFYPGTPSVNEAQRLRVTAGSENTSVNFALVPARTVKVSGTVIAADGQPASQGFLLLQLGGENEMSYMVTVGGPVQPDGTFTLSNVAPGDYVLHVNLDQGDDAENGSLPITVTGSQDLTGLTLTTAAATRYSGQLVFDGPLPTRLRPTEFQFFLRPLLAGSMMFGGAQLVTKDDWTIEGRGSRGPLVVEPGRLPDGWMIRSVLLNGEDVTDTGLPTRSGDQVDGIQIVLTPRLTAVSGSVTTESGQPARDYVVVFFPEDPALWRGGFSRRQVVETPDQQGRFEAKKLPAGHYLAAALDYVEDGRHTDPEFLESLRAWATPFDVREGETKTLALKLIPRP